MHGPNLNLLGEREPHVYGTATLDDYVATAKAAAEPHGLPVEAYQTNHEGELVELIHAARGRSAAIIINPGTFTHYAWSDARRAGRVRRAVSRGAHLQPERPRAVAAHQRRGPVATGSIVGLGMHGYELAVQAVAAALDR